MQPYFQNFADFIQMGGHGAYVWASWGITIICLLGLIFYSRNQRKTIYHQIRTQQAREKQRQERQRS